MPSYNAQRVSVRGYDSHLGQFLRDTQIIYLYIFNKLDAVDVSEIDIFSVFFFYKIVMFFKTTRTLAYLCVYIIELHKS